MRWSSGSFHATLPFSRHWCITSRTCVASTQPATSTEPSATTCASVPSTGPVVITGEQIRTRRRAQPDALRDLHGQILAVTGREPGAQPVLPAGIDEAAPRDVTGLPQLLEVERERLARSPRRARRRPRSPAATMSRRSSSASRSRPCSSSRTTYLWCIRSGTPAIALPSTGSARDQQHVRLGRRRHRDRVRVVDVVGEAHAHAARRPRGAPRPRRRARSPRPRSKSYCARSSDRSRAVEEVGDEPRDLARLLAAVRQSSDLDALAH